MSPRLSHALIVTNVLTLAALVWSTAQSRAQPEVYEHLRARVIDIVNERGEMRAQLYVQENGGGGIRIYSPRGEIRSKYGALNDGGAGLLLMDESTTPTVVLKSTANAAELKLAGSSGERVIKPDDVR
jgi:hypothetical protein